MSGKQKVIWENVTMTEVSLEKEKYTFPPQTSAQITENSSNNNLRDEGNLLSFLHFLK